ncbi:malate dehydrogenase [Klebsiella michiganensis]|nr:malate dehydrogenase [Klebsiella michiganensis]
MPLFSDHHLRSLLQRHLVRVGTGPDIAQKVADNLVEASLKGHDSHGVTLLPRYIRPFWQGFEPWRHAHMLSDAGPIVSFDGGTALARRWANRPWPRVLSVRASLGWQSSDCLIPTILDESAHGRNRRRTPDWSRSILPTWQRRRSYCLSMDSVPDSAQILFVSGYRSRTGPRLSLTSQLAP